MKWLLFESFHLAQNHKLDVLIIAKMLKQQGEDVVIFDIFHEYQEDIIEGISVLHWTSKNKIPDDSWINHKQSKVKVLIKSLRCQYLKHRYMVEVRDYIENIADAFYCGSYNIMMSSVLLRMHKPCYWWGLRSERFHAKISLLFKRPVSWFYIAKNKRRFLCNEYQKLFVSNCFILDEHFQLGIPRERMIIREERCVETLPEPQYELLNDTFSFLTIGQLRPDKRIEYIINEFSTLTYPCIYTLAGKSQVDYEQVISDSINGLKNVVRVNKYLNYSDFNQLIKKSHFVVFADKHQSCSVTNGTLMESLINFRPVIVPNYNPYKFYVEKYKIGLLYNPSIPGNLSKVMKKAIDEGSAKYENSIKEFLKTILFDKLSDKFFNDIKNCSATVKQI